MELCAIKNGINGALFHERAGESCVRSLARMVMKLGSDAKWFKRRARTTVHTSSFFLLSETFFGEITF